MIENDGEATISAMLTRELEMARARIAELERSVSEHACARMLSEERYRALAEDLEAGAVIHGKRAADALQESEHVGGVQRQPDWHRHKHRSRRQVAHRKPRGVASL